MLIQSVFLLFLANLTLSQLNKGNAILTFEIEQGKTDNNFNILFNFKVSLMPEIQHKRNEISEKFNPLTLDFKNGDVKGEDRLKAFRLADAISKENLTQLKEVVKINSNSYEFEFHQIIDPLKPSVNPVYCLVTYSPVNYTTDFDSCNEKIDEINMVISTFNKEQCIVKSLASDKDPIIPHLGSFYRTLLNSLQNTTKKLSMI